MKSIRTCLLVWLLPSFAVICVLAGWGLYQAEKASLESELVSQLQEMGGMARTVLRGEGPRPRFGPPGPQPGPQPGHLGRFTSAFEFEDSKSGQYFQVWVGPRGEARKSLNLGNRNLKEPIGNERRLPLQEHFLEDGERVLTLGSQLVGRNDEVLENIAVAISCSAMDERLDDLIEHLFFGGLVCCAALILVLAFALHFALKPALTLGEQARSLTADSLHERFSLGGMSKELKPVVERLNELMDRLKASFERERQFSSDLAHEMRTPLAGIRTTAEVAIKFPDEHPVKDLEEIAKVAISMQGTVDGLLMLARLESDDTKVDRESIEVVELARDCVDQWKKLAGLRSVSIVIEGAESLAIDTDRSLLRAIVSNLIGNAVQYAPEHSEVSLSLSDEDTFLAISNLAPEMDGEDVDRMFDRLWRRDKARADDSHAGLGLSISRRCSELLGFVLETKLGDDARLDISLSRKAHS